MQTIQLKKFGTVLVSRPDGREAFNAIRPTLDSQKSVWVDFGGTLTVTPGWFDEFLTHLAEYMHGQVELLPTDNASVLAMLPVLGQARGGAAADVLQRALERMRKS